MIHSVESVPPSTPRRRRSRKRYVLAAVGAIFVLATFAFFLPQIADYRDVWAVVKGLSWAWLVALAAATLLNLATFAPPWQAALPGALVPVCLRAHAGLDGAVAGRPGRGGSRDRGLVRHPPALGLSEQGHRARRHAREPVEPVREPVLPGRRRVPARGRGQQLSGARDSGIRRRGRARHRRGGAGRSAREPQGCVRDRRARGTAHRLGAGQVPSRAGRLGRGELRAVSPRGRGSAPDDGGTC